MKKVWNGLNVIPVMWPYSGQMDRIHGPVQDSIILEVGL